MPNQYTSIKGDIVGLFEELRLNKFPATRFKALSKATWHLQTSARHANGICAFGFSLVPPSTVRRPKIETFGENVLQH